MGRKVETTEMNHTGVAGDGETEGEGEDDDELDSAGLWKKPPSVEPE